MSNFTPRLDDTGISGSSYYYINNPFYNSGYGMPNCTAYAWARFWEEAPDGGAPGLSLSNAEDWYTYTQDGYARGQVPKLGAVLCLKDGPYSGDGHVCIVEKINQDGSIVTSNSAYNGAFFYLETRQPPDYNPDGYIFQGFIYNPRVQGAPAEPTSWITGNRFLSRTEQDQNAIKFYYVMTRLGVSYNAILGMLANLEDESTINPGIWEGLDPYNGGYGLVQWTPYTKYSNWAGSNWENNGQKECERIKYEADNGIQWFDNPAGPDNGYPVSPPVTFAEYIASSLDPKVLADYWVLYYEHPYEGYLPGRIAGHQSKVDYYDSLLGGGGFIKNKLWLLMKAALIKRSRG